MEGTKRTYGLLPLTGSSHVYQVGKVKFHVASYFSGKTTIEERLAGLMIEDLYEELLETGCFSAYRAVLLGEKFAAKKGKTRKNHPAPWFDP